MFWHIYAQMSGSYVHFVYWLYDLYLHSDISYYLKSDFEDGTILRDLNAVTPRTEDVKHSLDIKGNIKGHTWFVSMGAVIENLINLNISTSYFLVTHIVVLLSL